MYSPKSCIRRGMMRTDTRAAKVPSVDIPLPKATNAAFESWPLVGKIGATTHTICYAGTRVTVWDTKGKEMSPLMPIGSILRHTVGSSS